MFDRLREILLALARLSIQLHEPRVTQGGVGGFVDNVGARQSIGVEVHFTGQPLAPRILPTELAAESNRIRFAAILRGMRAAHGLQR